MAFSRDVGRPRGYGSIFEDDPFFSGFPSFPDMGFSRHPALSNGSSGQVAHRRDPFSSMWPFGGEDPFTRMDSMMRGMMQGMGSNPNAHSFSSSSVMHYSSSGDGRQPKVYHATSSTRQAGGVKETRRSVRDSESGLQKMAIGHHINDRSHTIERRMNTKTNEKEEHQEFVNLTEDDAQPFDQEWQEKSRHTRLRRSHHTGALPSPNMPAKRDHTHRHHHPYKMPQHHRGLTDDLEPGHSSEPSEKHADPLFREGRSHKRDLEPGFSSVHSQGLMGEPSKEHADQLFREERRHKGHADELEPGFSSVHSRGPISEPSKKHADPLVKEGKRHKHVKREKKVHF